VSELEFAEKNLMLVRIAESQHFILRANEIVIDI
jgi:hypothetical protein